MFIKPDDIGLALVNDRHAGHLRVTVYYANGSGNYLGEVWKNVDFNLSERTYQTTRITGVPFTIRVPLSAKKQILKIVVYDPQLDRIGSRVIKMK